VYSAIPAVAITVLFFFVILQVRWILQGKDHLELIRLILISQFVFVYQFFFSF